MEKYQYLIFILTWLAFLIILFLFIRKQNKKTPFNNVVFRKSNRTKARSYWDLEDENSHLDNDGSDYH